jgi:hypothetical protein
MAIAEHHPGELYARNKALLKMTPEQLHDFAATKQKGLPKRKKPLRRKITGGPTRPLKAALKA